jgi:hypothetical protein
MKDSSFLKASWFLWNSNACCSEGQALWDDSEIDEEE